MIAPAPSHTTIQLAPDTHAYRVMSGFAIASAGGTVSFAPASSLSSADRAAIASQIIAVLEKFRDDALAADESLALPRVPEQREAGAES